MKLNCEVGIFNRLLPTLNIVSSKERAVKSVLALGKEPTGKQSYFLMLFSSASKLGKKFKVNDNIEQVFCKYCHEGKATIRFTDPPSDIRISADPLQLKVFLKALKLSMSRDDEGLKNFNLSNISVTVKNTAVTKLIILDIQKYPSNGLPRTLTHLQISGIKMLNFKREILVLRNLKILDLSNNQLKMIPPELGKLPQLLELHLGNNDLGSTELPDWRWLEGDQILNKLRLLDMSRNKLGKKLPHTLKKLTKLVTLKLDYNELTYLPRGIGKMSNLSYLSASHNNLTSLPASITLLNFELMDLSSNCFNDVGTQLTIDRPFRSSRLAAIAATQVLKYQLPYNKRTIPFTLVEYLDMSYYCRCGSPTLSIVKYDRVYANLQEFCRVVILERNISDFIYLDCYYCSFKCYKHFGRSLKRLRLIF